MGLFDRFKKKQVDGPQEEREPAVYTKELTDGETVITVSNLARINKILHRDQSKTELVIGRIAKYKERETLMWDDTDYIAFEMPLGSKITKDMLEQVINQYDIDKRSVSPDEKAFYIGRMQEQMGKFSFGNKSAAVQNMVAQQVDSMIQSRSEQIRESYERNERLRQEEQRKAREQDEIRRREYNAIRDRERAQRKSNPELTSLGSYNPGGKIYTDYDGTDMITGDILRLRQVDKVCKDSSGTYLYSAYIDKAQHNFDAVFLGESEPAGCYVCFTLPGRLEDIVKSGDKTKITQVLELLSDSRNFQNEGHLTYVGGIDRNGMIDRSTQPTSVPLANRVQKMQQDYEQRNAQFNQRGRYTNDEGR